MTNENMSTVGAHEVAGSVETPVIVSCIKAGSGPRPAAAEGGTWDTTTCIRTDCVRDLQNQQRGKARESKSHRESEWR